jgi:phage repressor protein C with HTH and peptisase S24 domain
MQGVRRREAMSHDEVFQERGPYMSLGRILRTRRKELNLTLDEVSRRAGCSKPYLSTIETEKVKSVMSDELLRRLERVLQFRRGELLRLAHESTMPVDIRQQYEAAEARNERYRQLVRKLIGRRAEKVLTTIEKPTETIKAGRLIPIINKVAAGYPRDFQDLEYPAGVADDYVRCPDVHDPNAFAVRVVGDSMETRFREGDVVVFSPASEVRSGDDCFIRFADPHETTFKRVFFEKDGGVRLQPRNEKYPPVVVDAKRINGIYRAILKIEEL